MRRETQKSTLFPSTTLFRSLSSRLVVDAAEPHCRESRVVYGVLLALAARREQDDRLVLDAPGDKAENAGGGPVPPVRVLGDDPQRRLLSNVGEQLEQGGWDEEPVSDLRPHQAQRRQER